MNNSQLGDRMSIGHLAMLNKSIIVSIYGSAIDHDMNDIAMSQHQSRKYCSCRNSTKYTTNLAVSGIFYPNPSNYYPNDGAATLSRMGKYVKWIYDDHSIEVQKQQNSGIYFMGRTVYETVFAVLLRNSLSCDPDAGCRYIIILPMTSFRHCSNAHTPIPLCLFLTYRARIIHSQDVCARLARIQK